MPASSSEAALRMQVLMKGGPPPFTCTAIIAPCVHRHLASETLLAAKGCKTALGMDAARALLLLLLLRATSRANDPT